jgi:hypothetical protein
MLNFCSYKSDPEPASEQETDEKDLVVDLGKRMVRRKIRRNFIAFSRAIGKCVKNEKKVSY